MNRRKMQTTLEAALEQINSVRAAMSYDGLDPYYHLGAAERYVNEVWRAMNSQWGKTEGQLCPNKECCYDLVLSGSGWYRCGNCGQVFEARSTDSDFEDYHNHTGVIPDGEIIHDAEVIGPSWASPENGQTCAYDPIDNVNK